MDVLAILWSICTLLSLLPTPVLSIETATKMTKAGPKVCLTSTAVITKYVNAICEKGDKLIVAGMFNRLYDAHASSFAVIDRVTGDIDFLGGVGARSLLENTKRDPEGNFLSTVSTMFCPSNEPFVYIGGMFRNITQYYDEEGNAVSMHAAKGIIHTTKEEIFNNVAKFDPTTNKFYPLVSNSSATALSVGVVNKNSTHESPGLVRTLTCTSDNATTCSTMYLGGSFTNVFGKKAGGIAKLTFEAATTSSSTPNTPLASLTEIMDLSDSGVAMSVATNPSLPTSPIVVGGIFGPSDSKKSNSVSTDSEDTTDGVPYPAKIIYPALPTSSSTSKTKCIISTDMMSVNACLMANTPSACCESLHGAAHSILQVTHDEILVGGSFAASVSMKFEAGTETPTDPSDQSATPSQPDPEDQEAVQPKSETGYQNFQRFFVPRLLSNGKVSKKHANEIKDKEKMTGGPNGEVMSITCLNMTNNVTHMIEPYGENDVVKSWRCTEVLVAGRFDSWESYYMNETSMQTILNETATFSCKQGIARLIYDFNDQKYKPYPLSHDTFPDIALNRTDEEILTSVNWAIRTADGSAIYAGGEFAKFNNVYKMTTTSLDALLPTTDTPSTPTPSSEFYKCMGIHEKNQTGEKAFYGSDFCCRTGSYCPDLMVDIPCPAGWGYFCTPQNITTCKKGSYCEEPGEQVLCPKGHTCGKGSTKPLKCAWWELCIDEGQSRTKPIAGLTYAVLMLGMLIVGLSIAIYFQRRYERWSRNLLDKSANLRFNAFSSNASLSNKSASLSSQQMEMVSIDGEDLPAEPPKLADNISSSIKFSYYNPFARSGRSQSSAPNRGFIGRSSSYDGPRDSAIENRRKRQSTIFDQGDNKKRIDIEFNNMSVVLSDGRKILNEVSGSLRSGEMTAIMGPSGCGKSTTISALTNRIKNGGKVTGEILINQKKTHLMTIQHLIGFVPQDDIMHRDLTVRETLRFQAKLKADPKLSNMEKRAFVNEVLDVLGLTHVQHTLIGDEFVRGISGGQRKRVNIGIELMASPLVLFLDEPTSGLDATTTMELIDSLEKLAGLGLTIAMVIHQPRMEVLNKIDNLMLLQRGGFPVYIGPTQDALKYFENVLRCKVPPATSTADFFLDVITANQTQTFDYGDLTECFNKYKNNTTAFNEFNPKLERIREALKERVIPKAKRPARLTQCRHFFSRSIRQMINSKRVLLVDSLILIFAGALAGFVAKSVTVSNNFTVCVNGIMAIMSALRIYGSEKANYLREMQAGMSSFAYWLGKALAYLPIIFLNPLFFMSSFYKLGSIECDAFQLYRIIVAVNFSATGIGCFISTVTAAKSAQLAGVVFGLVAIMTSGGNPTLKELEKSFAGMLMTKFTYGPFAMGSLYLRGATNQFKASFDDAMVAMADKGYTKVEMSIYSDDELEEAYQIVDEEVKYKQYFMMYQYGAYMFLTLGVLFITAKQEVGGILNNCLYNHTVQATINFAKKIWHGDLDEDEHLKRTSRGMKTRKAVKMGLGHEISDSPAEADKRTSVKRMSKTPDVIKKIQAPSKKGDNRAATGPKRNSTKRVSMNIPPVPTKKAPLPPGVDMV